MGWRHFHRRSIEVLDSAFIDQPPLLIDRLVTPSLPATAPTGFSAFALRYILRLSTCRLMEGFITPSLPHFAVEVVKLSMAPLLHPRYQTSQFLRATPPSCCLPPLSRISGYRADLLRRFLSGAYRTSPVSVASLLPCRRHYPAGVGHPFSQPAIAHSVFTSFRQVRPPELSPNEACSAFTRVATRSLAHQPEADFVGRLQHLDYSPCCYPS